MVLENLAGIELNSYFNKFLKSQTNNGNDKFQSSKRNTFKSFCQVQEKCEMALFPKHNDEFIMKVNKFGEINCS